MCALILVVSECRIYVEYLYILWLSICVVQCTSHKVPFAASLDHVMQRKSNGKVKSIRTNAETLKFLLGLRSHKIHFTFAFALVLQQVKQVMCFIENSDRFQCE